MKDYPKFYKELNDRQRLAVDTVRGPLLVLAGPGTGKTQLLSVRAGSIIQKAKARPENILILTYTNPASKAMKERLARVIGPAGYDVEVGTFHGFANSIIQGSAEAANYVADKILMSDVEQAGLIEYILDNCDGVEEIRPFRKPYAYLKEILRNISDLKKDRIMPSDVEGYLAAKKSSYRQMEEKYIKRLKAFSIVYGKYESLKEGKKGDIFDERGRYDFDDMILYAVEALRKEPTLLQEYRKQYTHAMVDEFQDTNGAQLDLLFTLLDYEDPNICCVGDDDQSIYRFQGASVANFKTLAAKFPGIKTIQLEDNYRSSAELISISEKVIRLIPRHERVEEKSLKNVKDYSGKEILFKEFTTAEEELLYIVDKVRELKCKIEKDPALSEEERRAPYNNIAVLVRKRDQILKVVDAFLQAGIPYATDGKENISGEKRVAQLLDILNLVRIDLKDHEAKDASLYKVLSSDYFRIPQTDLLRFISFANGQRKKKEEETTLFGEFFDYFSSKKDDVRFAEPERLRHAAGVIKNLLEEASVMPVHKTLIDFIKDAGMFAYILKEYADNGILRIRQLRSMGSFVNMIKASDTSSPGIRLDEFLAEMNTRKEHGLSIQGSLVTLTQTGVRVYTAHGAKGLEFYAVIIPFCLQNKAWPLKPQAERIKIPFDLFKNKEAVKEKDAEKRLALQDETRLFYVAMTRAKSNLIFTASPTDDSVATSYLDTLDIAKELSSAQKLDEEELIAKSLEMTDSTDPFIGAEEVLFDMVSSLTLNPTRVNNYLICRRRFLYNDVLKLPGEKKKSLVFGNCVHKALEDTYKKYRQTKKFPPFSFFEGSFAKELKFQGVDSLMERDCLNRMKTVKDWFDRTAKEPVMPIDLEKKLMVTIGDNIIFNGKYDKVEWEDEKKGLVRVIDYKTGKPDDHIRGIDKCSDLASPDCDNYLRQLVSYRLLFEKDKKESRLRKVSHGVLVFLEPLSGNIGRQVHRKGEYVSKSVAISDEMVATMEGIIKDVWNNIKALRFEKLKEKDDKICGMCDFKNICWG